MCVSADKFLHYILNIYYILKKTLSKHTNPKKKLNPKIFSHNDVNIESYDYIEIKEYNGWK